MTIGQEQVTILTDTVNVVGVISRRGSVLN